MGLGPRRHTAFMDHPTTRRAMEEDQKAIATRHDRCPKDFLSAIAPAATVMFWL